MSTLRASRRRFASRKGLTSKGFTLIEILVVLSIAAIVTAITVGGFKEMTAGNKRVSCQSNLAQIYQACRLYASDEGGKFPYYNFNTVNDCTTTSHGTGLWMLYTFPDSSYDGVARPTSNKPIERYIRSAKVLHCPNDIDQTHIQLYGADPTYYNTSYLSYQSCDSGVPTYASVRSSSSSELRQLLVYSGGNLVSRPPDDRTIVAWCQFHRNSRNLDNVLFYDGSVQLLPNQGAAMNWQRIPKAPQ